MSTPRANEPLALPRYLFGTTRAVARESPKAARDIVDALVAGGATGAIPACALVFLGDGSERRDVEMWRFGYAPQTLNGAIRRTRRTAPERFDHHLAES